MDAAPDEITALRTEVEHLRAEVARLRSQQAAHVCVPSAVAPSCTCGTSAGCAMHPWQQRSNVWCGQGQYGGNYWQANACAAPFAGQTYWVDVSKPLHFAMPVTACAVPLACRRPSS